MAVILKKSEIQNQNPDIEVFDVRTLLKENNRIIDDLPRSNAIKQFSSF